MKFPAEMVESARLSARIDKRRALISTSAGRGDTEYAIMRAAFASEGQPLNIVIDKVLHEPISKMFDGLLDEATFISPQKFGRMYMKEDEGTDFIESEIFTKHLFVDLQRVSMTDEVKYRTHMEQAISTMEMFAPDKSVTVLFAKNRNRSDKSRNSFLKIYDVCERMHLEYPGVIDWDGREIK